ncbi:MAG: TonB-dependent receptor [Porphyromonadaceae bacterium]|nr:TonB-dependent receptor [Porphyromonadaceae bacterium]
MDLFFDKRLLTVVLLLILCGLALQAQSENDSVRQLREVVVTAKSYKEVIPAQKLSGKELESLNSFSVADAIRYFAGVQIKDYGGIGGLKTVNIRSMGTNHMGVFYDGIQLGNAQNGQIDLGKFSLENIEEISLYNGQKSEIFQPAKDFGSAGTIYLRSRSPRFEKDKNINLKFNFKTGSFHLVNPSLLWEQKIKANTAFTFNSEYIYSSGKYKYRYKRVHPSTHKTVYDTTAVRANGDIHALRLESGLYGTMEDGKWNVKTYFYNSERGIPGAIVNNVWKRSQRQWDRNFFTQASWQKTIFPKLETQVNAKYANDYMRYLNPDTTLMYLDNTFNQQEIYLSLANKYAVLKNWDVSLSADLQWNTLTSNLAGFVFPNRLTALIAVASALDLGKVKMQGSVLGTFVNEKIKIGNTAVTGNAQSAPDKQEFTPAFFVSYKPFRTADFNVHAFYKNIFRMPTFNDLYYTDIGNVNLKPEFTHQYDVGFQYTKALKNSIFRQWQIQADGYFNQVTNKIIAVPKGSGMYRWMMMNLGYVEIRGMDISTSASLQPAENLIANVKLTYTYQQAQDFTPDASPELQAMTWGGQIPYIPWHNGSAIASFQYKTLTLNYSFIYVGERYHNSANIPENYEQPWYTHDMNIVKNFKIKSNRAKISLEINNIFSQDYEVVLNYPMPKRNYKLILSFEV